MKMAGTDVKLVRHIWNCPVEPWIIFYVQAQRDQLLRLGIFDLMGERLIQLMKHQVEEGIHRLPFILVFKKILRAELFKKQMYKCKFPYFKWCLNGHRPITYKFFIRIKTNPVIFE